MAKILIIDDEEHARQALRRILESAKHTVIMAENGKYGLRMLASHNPELVITDIVMPEVEGIETIRAMVKMKPEVPIIAITGYTHSPFLKTAMMLGAVSGIHKPYKPIDILEKVQQALNIKN